MSGFEYLFTFYGLLLGLAVANVATGFADMWRSREAYVRAGLPLCSVCSSYWRRRSSGCRTGARAKVSRWSLGTC